MFVTLMNVRNVDEREAARQHPPVGEPPPRMSVMFADPPSVEGTERVQFVLEDEEGEPEEPPTAARVVTFAASVEVSDVSPDSCSADCGLVDAGAVIDDVEPPAPAAAVDPPAAPPPPPPPDPDGRVCVGTLKGSVAMPLALV
jgi:hypothetical protein